TSGKPERGATQLRFRAGGEGQRVRRGLRKRGDSENTACGLALAKCRASATKLFQNLVEHDSNRVGTGDRVAIHDWNRVPQVLKQLLCRKQQSEPVLVPRKRLW